MLLSIYLHADLSLIDVGSGQRDKWKYIEWGVLSPFFPFMVLS